MKILLGVPSSGMLSEAAAQASWLSSLHHQVDRMPIYTSGPNFNNVWCAALNQCMSGKYDLFAMMHTDIRIIEETDGKRWLDILVEELEASGAWFISVPNALKDGRAVTASGIGDPNDQWSPFRRFTVHELAKMPKTFTIDDTQYRGMFLLHNEALCLFDMRRPEWYLTDRTGRCRFHFAINEEIRFENGAWNKVQEMEDWSFSRDLWKAGIKTAMTTKIKLTHQGQVEFPNFGDWGAYQVDVDTKDKWGSHGTTDNRIVLEQRGPLVEAPRRSDEGQDFGDCQDDSRSCVLAD